MKTFLIGVLLYIVGLMLCVSLLFAQQQEARMSLGVVGGGVPAAAPPAGITIGQTGGTISDAGGTTVAVTINGVLAGSTIFVAVVADYHVATITVSDGTAYTSIRKTEDEYSGAFLNTFYRMNVNAGNYTITATFNASSDYIKAIGAVELIGAATSLALDRETGQYASGTTAPDNITSGLTSATTENGEAILGAVYVEDATTVTDGTNFTEQYHGNISGAKNFHIETYIQPAAGAIAATWTFGTARPYAANVATFKPAM